MKPELLQSLFHDIRDYGSVRIKKSKLLWMLGRFHETPSVWDMLMREWRGFDPVRPLYGMHWNDEITLAMARSHDIGSDWTTRREERDLPPLQLAFVS
ncbi:hypothetical protein [Aureimonas psammosilenae]|uniref:hypothetical protein n=1 Tax=Aureimonas psammosilenae TaxID=2495496 RepID=UPI001260E3D7|nr:hypothetical protein [Aureimonas psammosilenae]